MKTPSGSPGRTRRRRLATAAAVVGLAVSLPLYAYCAPLDAPESRLTTPGTVVLDANGVVLQRNGRDGFRIPVSLNDISPAAIDATIAAEDQRFRDHPGVDPIAIARALLKPGDGRSGASTLTQQLARRLYLDSSETPLLVRKARESLIALQLETHRSKDEIIALYLNEVYYGRGAYGIEAAARVYFGVSAANLDIARAAYLAGLPQLPTTYATEDPAAGKARQEYVLQRMADEGAISAAQAIAASADPLQVLPAVEPAIAPHFVAWVMEELEHVQPGLASRPGLVIETTLDAGLQHEAERLARLHVENLRDRDVSNAAVVMVEPGTGRVLAMVGSVAGDESGGAINMALTPRQPGSALKPFLYAAAFEHGYTAASPVLDVPVSFPVAGGVYQPQNFDKQFHGVVTLRTALASSLNIPAVSTLDTIGAPAFLDMAHRFGLTTLTDAERYGLSLALGAGEVRLLDLTAAYAAIGAAGSYAAPFAIARVRASDGTVLYEHGATAPRQVISPAHAYILADILDDPDARVPGFGQVTPLEPAFPAAAKTGTTTGFRDNWTLGFTASFAVGVWVGNADNRPMREVSGVDGAGPIWRDVMAAAAMSRTPGWPVKPANTVDVLTCAPTGLLPGPDCQQPQRELFVAGTEPFARETYYVRQPGGAVAIAPPSEAVPWARDAGFQLALQPGDGGGLQIIDPQPGSVFFLAPELPAQELVLRAEAPPGNIDLQFSMDGEVIAQLPAGETRLVWDITPGTHTFQVTARQRDGSTVSASTTFEVRQP